LEIRKIEAFVVSLGFREPFRISQGTSTVARNVIVKISTDNAVVGWGESSPSQRVTRENADTVIAALDKIGPALLGNHPLRIEKNNELMDSVVEGNPAAKAAVDIAMHDMLGRETGKPLYLLMGGYRREVLTDLTLSIKPPPEMADDAARAVRQGFRALKVKIGIDPEEDVKRVEMIRERVGNAIQIRVDANQGYTPEQAIKVLSKIHRFDIEFVEQPVAADDVKGLSQVRKNSQVPVMADESVHSPEDALRLVEAKAVDLINIKLMKCGGLVKGRKIAEIAEAAGVKCMVGCMSECAFGIAAAVHLAAAIRNIQYADLDSDYLLKDRLVREETLEIRNSMRVLSEEPGLGIAEIDRKLLGEPARVYS